MGATHLTPAIVFMGGLFIMAGCVSPDDPFANKWPLTVYVFNQFPGEIWVAHEQTEYEAEHQSSGVLKFPAGRGEVRLPFGLESTTFGIKVSGHIPDSEAFLLAANLNFRNPNHEPMFLAAYLNWTAGTGDQFDDTYGEWLPRPLPEYRGEWSLFFEVENNNSAPANVSIEVTTDGTHGLKGSWNVDRYGRTVIDGRIPAEAAQVSLRMECLPCETAIQKTSGKVQAHGGIVTLRAQLEPATDIVIGVRSGASYFPA